MLPLPLPEVVQVDVGGSWRGGNPWKEQRLMNLSGITCTILGRGIMVHLGTQTVYETNCGV